ncbi:unnamed protein product [Ceutorhynchus assimilis]|uniref:G-protein coupled receptors family 1 profile domain-containing protein n=1 Tax=Ceutorhynchus assimilis TaxID=467358 RepID=A0A9N9MQC0_9CUCU|nr:unnamed protein product [Ceutorhynchus assimilis]
MRKSAKTAIFQVINLQILENYILFSDKIADTSIYSTPGFLSNQEELENKTHIDLIERFKENWGVRYWTQGFFNEEYIYDINIHWLKFNPPKSSHFIILGVLYIVIMTFGCMGNGLVVFLFCRSKSLRTPANMLIVNLAVSDFLMLLKMPVFIYNCFYHGPVLGDIACRIYGFFGGLCGTASIGTLAAISFDRYFVVKYPLKRFSRHRIYFCLIFSWIYALCFSLIPLLDIGFGKYQYEGYLASCSFDYLSEKKAIRMFILIFFFAAFIVPLSIISFSYYKIVRVVGGRSRAVKDKRDSIRHVKEEDERKQELKLAIIVLIVIFLWLFSWTPYATVALLGISGNKHLITPLASMIPALFAKTTSAIDPFVYAMSHPKFREELWKVLKIFKKKKNPKNNRKVWSTEPTFDTSITFASRASSYDDDDGVEEEMVELGLPSVAAEEFSFERFEKMDFKSKERELKRRASAASLLCFKPTFTNKRSSFRRLSRRISTLSKSRSKEEDESTN